MLQHCLGMSKTYAAHKYVVYVTNIDSDICIIYAERV